MSDTYGKSVTLTIFGESHGPAVGATVTGLAPGVPVDMEFMRGQMEKRRPPVYARKHAHRLRLRAGSG